MSEILTLPTEVDEYEDDADILEAAIEDADEVPDEYRNPFPSEYVVGILGHRGGGKSALLAYFGFNCLAAGDTVFTNLEMHPEKLGIKNQPLPLDQDHLLKFDPSLQKAVLLMDEIGTWFERRRGMSTTSILEEKFLELVIRKQNLRIFFTNQSAMLPGALVQQTDVVYQGYDVFFCDWAREANLAKGTTFLYQVTDRTGIFGHVNNMWRVSLRRANRLWPCFNSYKVADPYAWARKTVIKGGEQVIDMDTGEAYSASEEGIRAWQKDVSAFSIALTKIINSYESIGLMDMARKHKAVEDLPDRLVFSVDRLRKGLVNIRGQKRQDTERAYDELRILASQGQLARWGSRHEFIELAKPVTEPMAAENLNSLSQKEWLNTAPIDDVVRDLYATGYKRDQIARRLKISEQTVNTVLQEQTNE